MICFEKKTITRNSSFEYALSSISKKTDSKIYNLKLSINLNTLVAIFLNLNYFVKYYLIVYKIVLLFFLINIIF